jgi:hypothetical protein
LGFFSNFEKIKEFEDKLIKKDIIGKICTILTKKIGLKQPKIFNIFKYLLFSYEKYRTTILFDG